MKKTFLLFSLAFASFYSFAQSTANYTFVPGTAGSLVLDANGNAVDMSTGTTQVLATSASQDQSINAAAISFPASFEFYFGGKRFNSFFATSNGMLQLGSPQVIVGSTYTIGGATAAAPRFSAFAGDLGTGTAGGIFGKLVGTAPYRCYVIEFRNMNLMWNVYTNDGTWQVRFYESTGVVEYIYGTMYCNTTINAGDATPEVGFAWGTAANQTLSITIPTLLPDRTGVIVQNTITAGANITNLNSGADGSRTVFSFTPPAVTGAPTGLNATNVAGTSMDLNWTDNSANELGFAVYRSTDNINFTYIATTAANATTYSATGLGFGTTYYWKVVAISEGAVTTAATLTQATNPGTLSGIKTVGTGGDYANLTLAFAAINTNGLAGNIELQLVAGYPAAAETYPIVSPAAIAAGSFGTKVYPAVSGLSITSANTTGTLNLNNASNITFDGRVNMSGVNDLVIANTNPGASYAVQFINDAQNNILSHLILQSVNTSVSSGTVVIGTTTNANGNDNNTIDNCDIKDGATFPANAIYSAGTTTTTAQFNDNVVISNNNIYNYFSAAAATAGILAGAGNNAWTITNNKLYQTALRNYTAGIIHNGIQVNSSGNGFIITANTIGFSSNSGTGNYTITSGVGVRFVGINFSAGTTTTSSIQGNTISGFILSTASGAATTSGIFGGINITSGSVNVGTTMPNIIGAGTGTGAITATSTASGALLTGINSSSGGVVNISNNLIGSLTINGSTTSASCSVTGIQVTAGTSTINGNTIGSATTPNSINSQTVATTGSQLIRGIDVSSGVIAATSIQSNTIANLNQNGTTTGSNIRGISYAGTGLATISLNTIYNLSGANANTSASGAGTGVEGILHTGAATTGAVINKNTIYTLSATNAGAVQTNVTGIGYSNPTTGIIDGNRIYDLRNASTMAVATTPPTASGILIRALATFVQVSNNMISLGSAQVSNTQFNGIWNSFATVGTINLYYNSVSISGTAASGALPSFGLLRGDNTAASVITTPVDIKNNIFSNTRTGGTGKQYAIGNVNSAPATAWGSTASNNNVLNSAAAATIGIWGLAADQTFSGWQTISSGDAASLSGVALPFTDVTTANLHLNFGLTPTPLESGAVTVAVTTDFDNQSRPGPAGSVNGGGSLPDIGADEFDAVPQSTPLAVKVVYFRGAKTTTSHILNWQVIPVNTANAILTLERSIDGRVFNKIYSVTATSTRMMQPFSYTNTDLLNGINYYRLKMTEDNGTVTYSDIVALANERKGIELINITPNPALSTAVLNINAAASVKLSVVITDISGKKVAEQNASISTGNNTIVLDVSRLTAGTYIVTVTCPSGACGNTSLSFVKH